MNGLDKDEGYEHILFLSEPKNYLSRSIERFISKSKRFDFVKEMQTKRKDELIEYIVRHSIMPLYNPLIFNLDRRKRVDVALEVMQKFDHVVPCSNIKEFIQSKRIDLKVETESKTIFFDPNFDADALLEKDLQIYSYAEDLYKAVPPKVLKSKIKIKGVTGIVRKKIIKGWVFREGVSDPCTVALYINGKKHSIVKADLFRKDLKENGLHSTGKCGFRFDLKDILLTKNHEIQVKVEDSDEMVPLSKKALEQIKEL